jgi:hypothetical protein
MSETLCGKTTIFRKNYTAKGNRGKKTAGGTETYIGDFGSYIGLLCKCLQYIALIHLTWTAFRELAALPFLLHVGRSTDIFDYCSCFKLCKSKMTSFE